MGELERGEPEREDKPLEELLQLEGLVLVVELLELVAEDRVLAFLGQLGLLEVGLVEDKLVREQAVLVVEEDKLLELLELELLVGAR